MSAKNLTKISTDLLFVYLLYNYFLNADGIQFFTFSSFLMLYTPGQN